MVRGATLEFRTEIFSASYQSVGLFHLPTTSICSDTTFVRKCGSSVVTSQLKLPDRLNLTFRSTTWCSFDCNNCKRRDRNYTHLVRSLLELLMLLPPTICLKHADIPLLISSIFIPKINKFCWDRFGKCYFKT